MGRVGDGGGLRLEREKEKGKETSRISSRRSPQRPGAPAHTCPCGDRPAAAVALGPGSDTVTCQLAFGDKSEGFCQMHIFLKTEAAPPNTKTKTPDHLKAHLWALHFSANRDGYRGSRVTRRLLQARTRDGRPQRTMLFEFLVPFI